MYGHNFYLKIALVSKTNSFNLINVSKANNTAGI